MRVHINTRVRRLFVETVRIYVSYFLNSVVRNPFQYITDLYTKSVELLSTIIRIGVAQSV
jgi:hypothetical protein